MNEHLSLSTATLLTPLRHGLRAGVDNTVDILVRVQSPDAPASAPDSSVSLAERPPQALALVIDRSGSMEGRPLTEAKRCAAFVVSRLRPSDAVSVVAFDNRVQRLWPAIALGSGDAVRGAIGRIEAGGSTDLHGGWLEGADTLSAVGGAGLKRVILLSDGGANYGMVDPDLIAEQCTAWAARGITTSTYGLGNTFNEELMVSMARAGGGNHYYGDTADDLMEPFEQELALLDNLALRQVELSASGAEGLTVEMLNALPATGSGWRLPDLAWGAEAWALLRVTVPVKAMPALGKLLSVLRVSVTGQSLQGEPVALERVGLALPVLSPASFDALLRDELVARRAQEVAAAEVLNQMRTAAQAMDWVLVDRLLAEAEAAFAGNEWVAGMLEAMGGVARSRSQKRMMKEALYSSSRLSARLASKDEGQFSLDAAQPVPAYLRRKKLQGKGDL